MLKCEQHPKHLTRQSPLLLTLSRIHRWTAFVFENSIQLFIAE